MKLHETPDQDSYLHRNPTPQEVIDNTRPAATDGALSAWQMRAWGFSLILIGSVVSDGTLHWHLAIPFEAKGKSAQGFRYVEVFPPPDEDTVSRWSFRPLDGETYKPVTWASVEANATRGRRLHAENLDAYADFVASRGP